MTLIHQNYQPKPAITTVHRLELLALVVMKIQLEVLLHRGNHLIFKYFLEIIHLSLFIIFFNLNQNPLDLKLLEFLNNMNSLFC